MTPEKFIKDALPAGLVVMITPNDAPDDVIIDTAAVMDIHKGRIRWAAWWAMDQHNAHTRQFLKMDVKDKGINGGAVLIVTTTNAQTLTIGPMDEVLTGDILDAARRTWTEWKKEMEGEGFAEMFMRWANRCWAEMN